MPIDGYLGVGEAIAWSTDLIYTRAEIIGGICVASRVIA